MKVVMAHNFLYQRGGAEKVFLDEMNFLRESSHEVFPFSRLHPRNISSGFEDSYPGEMDWESGSLFQKAKTATGIVYSREVYQRFKAFIAKIKPDVIHFHNIYARLTTALVDAAQEAGIPMVMTLHDYKLVCPSYFLLANGQICERCHGHRYYNAVIQRCHKGSLIGSSIYALETTFNAVFHKYENIDFFISPSRFLISKHDWRIPSEKLLYLPNALDLKDYRIAESNEGYLLFAGRLSKEKGLATLLEAVKEIRFPVVLAGEGPLESFVTETLKKPEWNHVRWVGHQEGEKLADLFRGARCVVFPSEWYENAPMSILEAYAYGKPVIGSRLGGMEELIQDNETGLLFQQGNAVDLRAKITTLMSDLRLVSKMGEKGRLWVEEKFDMGTHGRNLEIIYRKAIEKKRIGKASN